MGKHLFFRPIRLRTETLAVPELGEDASLGIAELPSKDLLDLQARHGTAASGLDFAADFLARCLVGEDGQRLFASAEECKEHLTQLPLSLLDRIVMAALKVSGLEGREVETAKN